MRIGWGAALVFTAAAVWGGAAKAHEFVCEKLVNGSSWAEVDSYPATVELTLRITNVHPDLPSVANDVEDPILNQWLQPRGFAFTPPPPFAVPVGQSVTMQLPVTIDSEAECLRMAAWDGAADGAIDDVMTVVWEHGSTQCAARLVCGCPSCSGPSGATRTLGFFQTHPGALQQCLARGKADLGAMGVWTLDQAQGLLLGNPKKFRDGTDRNLYEEKWFQLARQTLVATCNQRLFGTAPDPANALEDARAALRDGTCRNIKGRLASLTRYNDSGANVPTPSGFDAGKGAVLHPDQISSDRTAPMDRNCPMLPLMPPREDL